jgi:hypothetical protein
MHRAGFGLIATLIAFASWASASQIETKLCEQALSAAIPKSSSQHADDYYCQDRSESGPFVVFSIRAKHPAPEGAGADWVGSNLVGWYAICKSDRSVFEWDFANEKPGRALSRSQWKHRPPRAKRMCGLTGRSTRTPTQAMPSAFSWPVSVPSALRAPAPVN